MEVSIPGWLMWAAGGLAVFAFYVWAGRDIRLELQRTHGDRWRREIDEEIVVMWVISPIIISVWLVCGAVSIPLSVVSGGLISPPWKWEKN